MDTLIIVGLGLLLVSGIAALLFARERSGEPQQIHQPFPPINSPKVKGLRPQIMNKKIYRLKTGKGYDYYDEGGILLDPLVAITIWALLVENDPSYEDQFTFESELYEDTTTVDETSSDSNSMDSSSSSNQEDQFSDLNTYDDDSSRRSSYDSGSSYESGDSSGGNFGGGCD